MHIYSTSCAVPPLPSRSVALGVFDGLHPGHRAVIAAALQAGAGYGTVYTFRAGTVTTKALNQQLCTDEERRRLLEQQDVTELIEEDFAAVRAMTPEEFVDTVLRDRLHATALSCGYNYRFGKDGAGDVALLQALCARRGMALTVLPPITADGQPVSATAIRRQLAAGNMPAVRRLLGRSWGLSLPVVQGQHLGGRLGMPTVNQPIPAALALPRFGVYAASVEIGDETYVGVTNIGVRPTVGAPAPLAETWIQDYSGDLYGQTVQVYPVEFLRPEQKFTDLDALTAQVHRDAAAARAVFAPTGRIRAVLFDYDDTLHRRDDAFAAAVERFIARYYSRRTAAEQAALCRDMIAFNNYGYRMPCGYAEFIARFLPHTAGEPTAEAIDRGLRYFCLTFAGQCRLLPDVADTLAALRRRGLRLGLITNGESRLQNAKVDLCGLRPLLDLSAVSGDEGIHKPDPRLFRRIAARLGVASEDCLFVGDNVKNDIEGALSAGMQAAWIDLGHPAAHPCYDRPAPAAAHRIHALHELLALPELAERP